MRAKPGLAILASGVLALGLFAAPGCTSHSGPGQSPTGEKKAQASAARSPAAATSSPTSPATAKGGLTAAAVTPAKDPLPPAMPRQWPGADRSDVSTETMVTDKADTTLYNKASSPPSPAAVAPTADVGHTPGVAAGANRPSTTVAAGANQHFTAAVAAPAVGSQVPGVAAGANQVPPTVAAGANQVPPAVAAGANQPPTPVAGAANPPPATVATAANPPPAAAASETNSDASVSPGDHAGSVTPVATSKTPASDADYGVVTVFYGTDRAPLVVQPPPSGFSGWWWWTACSAILPAGLGLAAWKADRRRPWVLAAGAGLALSVLLGIVAFVNGTGGGADTPLQGTNYGPDRGSLVLGTCRVSVPKAHQFPRLDPSSLVQLGLHVDLSKNQVVLDVQPSPEENFYRDLKSRVAASSRKEAFVYVHGFNNSFTDAAQVAAELAVDLKFDGAPILYSWPSQATLVDYTVDECNVAWTEPHFKAFLLAVAQQSGATSIHLIAHSMGNRALTSVLEDLSEEMRDSTHLFRQVVLAAPDIDADTFRQEIAPAIVKTADRVTLYASSLDQALALSKRVHGYPRAGESGQQLVVVPGVDTIDVSAVDTGLIGHDYYTDSSGVVADLVDVIQGTVPPQKRPWLLPKRQADALTYWIFAKTSQALSHAPASYK